jgi:hypothetical protein
MENHMIIGAKITEKIQENLDSVMPVYHFYFKDNNPEYLQIIRVEGERVIGKMVKPGLPAKEVAPYAENVKSILKKICPGYGWTDNDIRVFAQTLSDG